MDNPRVSWALATWVVPVVPALWVLVFLLMGTGSDVADTGAGGDGAGLGLALVVAAVGAALGVLLVAAPYAPGLSDRAAWVAWVAGPALGRALLLVPGAARHLATGLVASALTLLLLVLLFVGAVA